jgi:hypothetical protein
VGRRLLLNTGLSVLLVLAAGVGIGYVCHLIGLNEPGGRLFQFLVAIPLALVGYFIVQQFDLRRLPFMLVVAAGSAAAIGSLHYFEYRAFARKWGESLQIGFVAQEAKQLVRIEDEIKRRHQAYNTLVNELKTLKPDLESRLSTLQAAGDRSFQGWLDKTEHVRKLARLRFTDTARAQQVEEFLKGFREDTGLKQELDLPAFPEPGESQTTAEKIKMLEEQSRSRDALLGEYSNRLRQVEDGERQLEQWQAQLGFWRYMDLHARQGVKLDFFGKEFLLRYETGWLYWLVTLLFVAFVMGGLTLKVHKWVQDVHRDERKS